MAIVIQNCKDVFFIFLLYFVQGTYGSYIRSSVTSSSVRLNLTDADVTSLSEISYSADASSVIHILRFTDATHSAYIINSLQANTTYTFNITLRLQDQKASVNETSVTLTTERYVPTGDDDDEVHEIYFYLTIGIGALCGVMLLILLITVCRRCCCRRKPKRHVQNNTSIIQRMKRRQHERDRQRKVPSEDISNYTNSIPGWNAKL